MSRAVFIEILFQLCKEELPADTWGIVLTGDDWIHLQAKGPGRDLMTSILYFEPTPYREALAAMKDMVSEFIAGYLA